VQLDIVNAIFDAFLDFFLPNNAFREFDFSSEEPLSGFIVVPTMIFPPF